jgi:hypothetical protein
MFTGRHDGNKFLPVEVWCCDSEESWISTQLERLSIRTFQGTLSAAFLYDWRNNKLGKENNSRYEFTGM